jgi:hypothetical protein
MLHGSEGACNAPIPSQGSCDAHGLRASEREHAVQGQDSDRHLDHDCHKSHHYGLVLSGAHVVYLDSYPLHPYSRYGAVPLREICREILDFLRKLNVSEIHGLRPELGLQVFKEEALLGSAAAAR